MNLLVSLQLCESPSLLTDHGNSNVTSPMFLPVWVVRDFMLRSLSLGHYFWAANLCCDSLNTTQCHCSVTQDGHFSHLPFNACPVPRHNFYCMFYFYCHYIFFSGINWSLSPSVLQCHEHCLPGRQILYQTG